MFDHTAAGRSGSAPPPTGCEPETSGVSVMRPELRQTLPFACVFTAFRLCFHCLASLKTVPFVVALQHRRAHRGPSSRRRDCHSAASPSPSSSCFNRDGEGASAK